MSKRNIAPVKYMQRTADYYFAQGFEKAYQWANFADIPWAKLKKPLSESVVTFITTAVPDGSIPKLSRTSSSFSIKDIPDEFRTDELSWDKQATHTRDRGSFIPLEALSVLADEGVIAKVSDRFHFVPTEYSQSNTIEKDAPAILGACQRDQVDIALLVPL